MLQESRLIAEAYKVVNIFKHPSWISSSPLEIIFTAPVVFNAFKVKRARNLLCRGTSPDLLSRQSSKT